ncbi:MAG: YceI family protein [Corynebacterium sp.]|nr:YceI family protein [Corynebacterium sp.]
MTTLNDITGTWVLDNVHSNVGFTVRHAMVTKVHGHFSEYTAEFTVNETGVDVNATLASHSITTSNEQRDEHLKSGDFFAAEEYPTVTFTATSAELGDGTEGTITGDLTIKDVTKPVTLDVEVLGIAEDPYGNTRLGFEATTQINRFDYNVDFNAPVKTGGALVGEKVTIVIEGSAIKQ